MEGADELLTVAQTAQLLGKSRPTIYQAIRNGSLPSERVLGRVGVRRRDAVAFGERTAGVSSKGGRPKKPRRPRGRPKKEPAE